MLSQANCKRKIIYYSLCAISVFFLQGTREAFVTLATNNYYAHGVIALGESLRQTGTQKELVAMLTAGVSEDVR